MNDLLLQIDKTKLPKHIAIILDGNGRWAKERGLIRMAGHAKGVETLGKIVKASNNLGIKNLTVYAFSTENIKRPIDEVNFLMKEFINFFTNKYNKLIDQNIDVRVIGEKTNLSKDVIDAIDKINNKPITCGNMLFTICFNYGSKQEIIHTTKNIAKLVKDNEIDINSIDEELFTKQLYTSDLEPLDLIIRTSGEYRLSNFLLWQAAYAEFYFTNTYFPDFLEDELYKAIIDYQKRNRRFGKLGE